MSIDIFRFFLFSLGFLVTFYRFLVILSRSTCSRFGFVLVSHFLLHKELYVHHKGHWGDEFGFSFLPSIKDCVFCYFHVFIWYKFHVSYIFCPYSFRVFKTPVSLTCCGISLYYFVLMFSRNAKCSHRKFSYN